MDAEGLLDRVRERLRTPPSSGVPQVDAVVTDALRPGKLLRPDLVVRSAAVAGGAGPAAPEVERGEVERGKVERGEVERRVVEGALAVELLHVATLVHDDIIDGSAVRRGRPSVVARAGVPTAIVVGDLLLGWGAAAAAASGGSAPATWARALACAASGQLREADLAAAPSLEAHAEYSSLKTAELFRASAELGALAVDAPPDVVAAHGTFGLHFGRAFQHVDDLLDTIGDPRRMGKPTGTDAANGVPTAVSLLSGRDTVAALRELVARELDAALAALPPAGGSAELGSWGAAALHRAFSAGLDGPGLP